MRAIDDLILILRNGGNIDLRAGPYSHDDLTLLCRNIPQDCTLVLRDVKDRVADELVQLARIAPRRVTIVFD
ncbi:MAG: hypothetical protein ACHQAQ_15135 [Hyphomicrobiales bacterium]|jgi:hypothetical protein